MSSPHLLQFFATPPQPCPYLPGRDSISLFADPVVMSNNLYGRLAQAGFRRSGNHVYRPACQDCAACVPVRMPVDRFEPRRRDRRCRVRNVDLSTQIIEACYSHEHFLLYRDYLNARHPQGGMDQPTPAHYRQFLMGTWSETWFLELRLADRLIAVAVTDQLSDGLSAVYTFYDPQLIERGLGNYAILCQIDMARAFKLPYLYLGYWVEGSRKMAYKGLYRPLEAYRNDAWHPLD